MTVLPAGRAPFEAIVTGTIPTTKETYEDGTITLISSTGATLYTDPDCRFRGRGNSTWAAPKKPYKVKASSNAKRPLGLPASSDWALMADYYDQSHLRSTISFEIARRATGRWAPHSAYVRLTWNGVYQGLYRLSETVDVQPGRVGIREMEVEDIAGNELTGPYFLEVNNPLDDAGWTTAEGTPILYDVPDVAGTTEQETYIQTWVAALEDALVNGTEEDILPLIDIDSWVDAYLLAESVRCQDSGWHKSCKWIKDQDSPNGTGKAILWAPWDYDLSLGTDLNDGGPFEQSATGWWTRTGPDAVTASYPNWYWYAWEKSPTFRAAVRARWTTAFKPVIDDIEGFIDDEFASISGLIAEDRTEWHGGGAIPTEHTIATIKTFLSTRAAWIDANIDTEPGGGDETAPTTPTGIGSTDVTDTTLTLTWSASTDNVGVAGYEYRRDGGSVIDAGAGLSEPVTGLTAGTAYDFEVRAYDAAGNRSDWSTVYTVETEAVAPPLDDYAAAVLADSPSLYWRLGETSGTSAADASGNGRTGTYESSYTLGQTSLVGDTNGAVLFAGGGSVVRAYEAWMDDRIITVEAVIKPTSIDSYQAIVALDGSAGNRDFTFYMQGGKLLIYNWADSPVDDLLGATTLSIGTTYHVAYVASATHQRVYVNGVLDGSVARPLPAPEGTARSFLVAASWAGNEDSRSLPFFGTIDEVAYYPEALSAAQLLTHAEAAGLA